MASDDKQNPSLGEAAAGFLGKLPSGEREASQQEVQRFVRWYGRERPFAGLTAHEIDSYAEQLSLSDTDYTKKLELIRAFLVYAQKAGWSKTNLSVHLKTRKTKTETRASAGRGLPETIYLTQQGYSQMEEELAALKGKRHQVIDEMRRAAADKDFRENAPLAAAREQRGHLEGRIKELEETLKVAAVMGSERKSTLKVNIGNSVVLCDLASGEELHYMIVNPKEVNPTKGKISSVSPIGKAIVGCVEGETIEVTVPAGRLRYQIKRVER